LSVSLLNSGANSTAFSHPVNMYSQKISLYFGFPQLADTQSFIKQSMRTKNNQNTYKNRFTIWR